MDQATGLDTGSPETVARRTYHPALDGLRGLAVLLVLADHFLSYPVLHAWHTGAVGVRIFFVLSGFLIVGNLLRDRDRMPFGPLVLHFFGRRALRLFPAFYVAIAVTALLGINNMRDDWWVHGLYLSNILVARYHDWDLAGHFWTLAVEMQFYVLCFPLAALLPRRWLAVALAILLVLGLLWRSRIAAGGSTFLELYLPGQFDAFAIGAGLALIVSTPAAAVADRLLARPVLAFGLTGLAILMLWPGAPDVVEWLAAPLFVALAAAAAVRACLGRREVPVLTNRWLVHVGRISYGLYVWHYFVGYALHAYLPQATWLDDHVLLRGLVWTTLSFAVAQVSWTLVETPALKLKTRV